MTTQQWNNLIEVNKNERNMTNTNKLNQLYQALKPIKKDSTNPHFKNKYFDINTLIAEIKPITEKLGLMIIQPLVVVDGRSAINTRILDSETLEVLVESTALLPDNPDPQKMGSAITYFRRYSIQTLLLLEAEDDDGNGYNEKPWLTENQFNAMKKAIEMGDGELVKKRMQEYNIKKQYAEELNNLLK